MLMFLVATALAGMGINAQSNSYINNREFPGVANVLLPGPLGYQSSVFSDAPMIVSNSMFYLNSWLGDGLLVSFSFFPVLAGPLMPALLALSLLRHLFHEPLGRRPPLPHVPRLFGYVPRSSQTSWEIQG